MSITYIGGIILKGTRFPESAELNNTYIYIYTYYLNPTQGECKENLLNILPICVVLLFGILCAMLFI